MVNQEFCQLPSKPVIAAFDFDGTITTRDSLPVFFKFTSGFFKTIFVIFLHLPKFIACLLGFLSRQEVKESLIKAFFYGMPIEELREEGATFAKGPLKHLLKENALLKLREHQMLGHRCILVSANLDVYLNAFAKEYGFTDCLCSKVAYDAKGKVTGRLQGINCWGEEKAVRLNNLLGNKDEYVLYAYGDARGDKEMLAMADHPFYRVF